VVRMVDRWSNIEPIVRALCARDLEKAPRVTADEIPALVDRYWQAVAAELAAKLRGDDGALIPCPIMVGIAAWETWLDDERSAHQLADDSPQSRCVRGQTVSRQ
jgi:hypothetical protein